MTTPTYLELTTPGFAGNGLSSETTNERILSTLAILASGQNPDGTVAPPISGSMILGGLPVNKFSKTLPVPAGTTLFGAHVNLAGQGGEASSAAFFEGQLGRKLAVAHHYYPWESLAMCIQGSLEQDDLSNGRLSMVSLRWPTLSAIINGSADAYITELAELLVSFAWPIILRTAWEMNGNWYLWSGPQNSSNPALFVQAWQHFYSILGPIAPNVLRFWCPNNSSTPGGTTVSNANNWRYYYPGDAWVDIVGEDSYNWGSNVVGGGSWQSASSAINPLLSDYLTGFGGVNGGTASKLPFWLGEVATYQSPGIAPAWICDLGGYQTSQKIQASIYFNTNNSPVTPGAETPNVPNCTTNSTATVTTTSPTFTDYNIAAGMAVTGTGIPANTTVLSVDSATSLTLSQAATTSTTQTLDFTGTLASIPWNLDYSAQDLQQAVTLANSTQYGGPGSAKGSTYMAMALALTPVHFWQWNTPTQTYLDLGSNATGTVTTAACSTTGASTTVTTTGNFNTNFAVGMLVSSTILPGLFPAGTTITAIGSATSMTVSAAATQTIAGVTLTGVSGVPTSATILNCPAPFPGLSRQASFNTQDFVDLGLMGTWGSTMSAGFTIAFWWTMGSAGAAAAIGSIFAELNTGSTTGLEINTNCNHSLALTAGTTAFWLRAEDGTIRNCDTTALPYDGVPHYVVWVCDPTVNIDTVYIDGAAAAIGGSSNATWTGKTTANFAFSLYMGAENLRGAKAQGTFGQCPGALFLTSKASSAQAAVLYAAATT